MLGPNGSLYPWIAPLVLASVGGTLIGQDHYIAGAIFGILAIAVRWLHQIALDRREAD